MNEPKRIYVNRTHRGGPLAPREVVAREIQNTAQFVAASLGSFADPRDGAAAMALAITANIWAQRPKDEAAVRKIMAGLTDTVVECWKKQEEFAKEQAK